MGFNIALSDIDFDDDELDAVNNVIKSKWLSMGPVTQLFEKRMSKYLGVKHAFCVSNCTAALHMANRILGIGPGDEVIVPSLTFVATANSVLYCNASPVFADITGIDDWNIFPDDICEKITDKTKAIIVVHYGGYSCNMDEIMETAEEYNLKVIEDAAHAPGSEYKGRKCGTIGDIGCFSFFSNKNMVTGEGGLIATNNDQIADKIKVVRSHGMTSLSWDRHKGHAFNYDVVELGYNYRLNEIAAALGLVQLKKLDKNNKKRFKIVRKYREELGKNHNIKIPFLNHQEKSSHHIFPILILHKPRIKLMNQLRERGIQTSVHYNPVHLFSYYKKLLNLKKGSLPKTEYVGAREVSLPLHPLLTTDNIDLITTMINDFS